MILTEAAYMPKEIVEQVLLPMLNVRGKKLLMESTARGRNWFYEYYMRGNNRKENPEFANVMFTYLDNPLSNLSLIATIKKTIPQKVFEQEFLCRWVDKAQVFNNVESTMTGTMISAPVPGHRYFAGIDCGLVSDNTSITILNQLGDVIFLDAFTDLPAPQVKDKIKSICQTFKPVKTYIERNGLGLPIYQDLKPEIPGLEPFLTTNESKSEIISNLINGFESGLITLPKNADELKDELDSFGFAFSKTGKILYNSISGKDDRVLSLAFAYSNFLKNKRSGKLIVLTG
jgi:hypothetical protein